MVNDFDEASYQEGREAFANGVSLRDLVMDAVKATGPAAEAKVVSKAIGFVDGVLDFFRNYGSLS